jgi:flagellar protein FlaI
MGEIRGEEGRVLFQVMSTGHTTYTTFHADSVGEVIKRFTTDPINVSKTMFTALDLVSIQTQTRVEGRKVRRNRVLTDVNYFDTENDEINVQDVYQWQPETDEFLHLSESNNLDDIMFDRGWSRDRLEEELFMRRTVLAYLIEHDLNTYAEVAATIQAFINDPDTILTLMARDRLEESLQDLRGMESVLIDVNPEKEALVPRPEATPEKKDVAASVLDEAEERLFEDYADREPSALVSALPDVEDVRSVVGDVDVDPLTAAENGTDGVTDALGDQDDVHDVAVDDEGADDDGTGVAERDDEDGVAIDDGHDGTERDDGGDAARDPFDPVAFSLDEDDSDPDGDDFEAADDDDLDSTDGTDGGDFDFDTEE